MIFRFDDVCINSDMKLLGLMTDYLFLKYPACEVIYAISPLVHSSQKNQQRVFPEIWNAHSDPRIHYQLNNVGIPNITDKRLTIATHGICHVDHRLLDRYAQEMSILISASLTGAAVFVPPFNKWNADTEEICRDNGIELIKFEDGWMSGEFNKFSENSLHDRWYFHARCWTVESFMKWMEA